MVSVIYTVITYLGVLNELGLKCWDYLLKSDFNTLFAFYLFKAFFIIRPRKKQKVGCWTGGESIEVGRRKK